MSYYSIPLTNDPDQTFACNIPIDSKNITLNFRLRYNTEGNYWWMQISDKSKNILIDSIPLVYGMNLLEQYNYLGIGSAYLVRSGLNTSEVPSDTTLASDYQLIWGDTGG